MNSRRLAIYALIALLALTPLMAAMPAPAVAAIEKPEVSIDYPYLVVGTEEGVRTITIVNPLDNPDIEEIRIILPEDSADDVTVDTTSGFIGTPDATVVGTWVVVISPDEDYGFLLPDGGKGEVTLVIDPEDAETEEGVVDKYKVTVKMKFVTGEWLTETVYLYEGCATGVEVDVLYEGESVEESTAGEEITITVQTINATGYTTADEGVPIVIWGEYTEDGETTQVKIAEVFTDSDGYAEATYTPTKAIDWTFYADVIMDTPPTGAILSRGSDTLTVKAAEPTKVVVNTEYDVEDYDVTYLTSQEVKVWVSLADKYGNTVEIEDAYMDDTEVTLTPNKGVFIDEEGNEVEELETTLDKVCSEDMYVIYKPESYYGTYALITATIDVPSGSDYEGTYTGSSKTLKTSTFAEDFDVTVDDYTVPAGEYTTITVELEIAQEGVPVTFEITEEDYGGHLSAVSTTTDEDGVATTKLYVDTEADAETKVEVTVAKPETDNPDNVLGPKETGTITTEPGEPAGLGIEAPEAVEPGKTDIEITVYIADAYGNKAEGYEDFFGAAIKVSLTASAGELEKNYTYISPGAIETTVLYTAPEELGTVVITASTTQYGLGSSSAEILVTTLNPIVNITQPAVDTTITTSENTTTTYIAGWAKPSPAAEDVSIREIKYSLDGADNVTVAIISTEVETGKVFFNFSVTLTVNATHTITVYAVDTEDYEGSDTRVITVEYAPGVPVMPTEISDASTDKTSYSPGEEVKVTATVTNVDAEARNVTIRITFIAPDGTPQYPISELSLTLEAGQSVTPTATYLAGELTGTWTAKIMVIDTVTGEAIAEPVELTVTVS